MNFHFLFKANNQKDKICNYSDNMKVLKCMNDLSLDMYSIHLGSFKRKKKKNLMPESFPQRFFSIQTPYPGEILGIYYVFFGSICAIPLPLMYQCFTCNHYLGSIQKEGGKKEFLLNMQNLKKCYTNKLGPVYLHKYQCLYPQRWKVKTACYKRRTNTLRCLG